MSATADNSDPRDYILDLSSSPPPAPASTSNQKEVPPRVPHLSIYFRCCNIYAPIYRNATGTAFAGHCPRCQRPIEILISPDGSTNRIFQAG